MVEHHGPTLWTYWGSFILYVGILFLLTRKKIKSAWMARRTGIQTALTSNQKILSDAATRLATAKTMQSNISSEIEQIKLSIGQGAESEAETLLADAREEAERVTRQSHDTVTLERRAALTKAQKKIVDQIFADAEVNIKAKMNADADGKLRSSAMKTFGEVYH